MDITLIGKLGNDVEHRTLGSGNGLAKFSLAVNRNKKVGDEWETETTWFRAVAFGKLADNLASLKKGQQVIVVGYLKENSYTDKDGNERKSIELVVNDAGPSIRWHGLPSAEGSSIEEVSPF